MIHAFAAQDASSAFERFAYDPGNLADDDVEIDVETCGICHSDLSMKQNDWGLTSYPFVGGHEVIGTISATGDQVTHLKVGQRVGLGWYSSSCGVCPSCLQGDQNLCEKIGATIVSRHGGFANKARASALWCTRLPESLDAAKAGPLFCGGITVFNPIVQNGISALDHVAVVGIGGLGHLAIQFLSAWGCEVTAITTSESKAEEARSLGADHVLISKDEAAMKKAHDRFRMILVTVNVPLDWEFYMSLLARRGTLHVVGAVPSVSTTSFPLIEHQKSITGSPLGSPGLVAKMLDFCARKDIHPVTQHFPMSRINEAFEALHAGQARYRLVLDNDFE
ncbi:MAG: NAD(P)-dependent alcohol dehydrogenase [Verrucomicrobiota bacterium]